MKIKYRNKEWPKKILVLKRNKISPYIDRHYRSFNY